MKISKYLISVILISIALIFIGEIFSWNLNEFEVRYTSVTFYPQKGIAQDEMIKDIVNAAEEKNVNVFVVDHNIQSYIYEVINIYGTNNVAEFLRNDAGIEPRNYKSLFLGDIDVNIHPFDQIPDITRFETYRVVGKDDNIIQFKKALVNKYAGGFPKEGYEPFNIQLYTISIWVIVFLFILLLTIYQICLKRKEMVIKLISGEDLTIYIQKNIFIEFIYYIIILSLLILIWSRFIHITFNFDITLMCISVFLIINSSSYLLLSRINYKIDVYRHSKQKIIFNISYMFKTFITFIMILVVANCTVLIYDGVEYYKQKGFFLNHMNKSYVMISISSERIDIEHELKQQLCDKLEDSDICTLVELTGFNGSDNNYVYADKGAVSYLKPEIAELENKELNDKAYILCPKNYKKTGNISDDSEEMLYSYSQEFNIPFERIEYEGNVKIIAQNGEDGVTSEYKKNPVIILNNTNNMKIDDYIWQGMMLDVDEVWDDFVKGNELDEKLAYKTNVYENYIHNWNYYKRRIALGTILVFIMLFIEMIIIKEILKFEYSVNSIEIALKKISGYGIIQRYINLINATIWSGVTSILVACMISTFQNTRDIIFILSAGIISIIIEIFFTILYISKVEYIKINRILKGDII